MFLLKLCFMEIHASQLKIKRSYNLLKKTFLLFLEFISSLLFGQNPQVCVPQVRRTAVEN